MGWIQDTGTKEGSNVNTLAFSFVSLPNVGAFIGMGSSVYAGSASGNSMSVTDNQGNTYTKDVQVISVGLNVGTAINRTVVQTSAGTFTITLACGTTSGNYFVTGAGEFNQISPTLLDRTTSNLVTSGVTTGTTGATLITQKRAVLVLACISTGTTGTNQNITLAAVGYTKISEEQDYSLYIGHQFAYKVTYVCDTQQASWNFNTSQRVQMTLATYGMNVPNLMLVGSGV